jgi:hypothetical protein
MGQAHSFIWCCTRLLRHRAGGSSDWCVLMALNGICVLRACFPCCVYFVSGWADSFNRCCTRSVHLEGLASGSSMPLVFVLIDPTTPTFFPLSSCLHPFLPSSPCHQEWGLGADVKFCEADYAVCSFEQVTLCAKPAAANTPPSPPHTPPAPLRTPFQSQALMQM